MHRTSQHAFLIVLLAAIALPALPAQNGRRGPQTVAPPAPKAFSMGFVDMEKLIEKHPETKSRTDALQAKLRVRTDELRTQMDEMRSISDNKEIYAEGSQEHFKLLKRIKTLEAKLELEKKIIQIEFNLELVNALKDIYRRCRAVVGEVAKERGIDVIAMYSSSDVAGRTRTELVGDILTRPFVYHDGALDITEEVLKRLK